MERLICKICSSKFEIPDSDLPLYKKFGIPSEIPFPDKCHSCIEKELMVWRNERHLYSRKCDATGEKIVSIYPEGSPFKVYSNDAWWSDKFDPLEYGQEFDFSKPFFGQFAELLKKVPRLALAAQHNENSDFVNLSNYMKDCYLVFGAQGDENCAYSWRIHDCLGCYECTQLNDCQYCYECVDCDNCYNTNYSQNSQNCTDSEYLYNCRSCKDCFLCANLQHKRFSILNEQLTEEEYKKRKAEFLKLPREEFSKLSKKSNTNNNTISNNDNDTNSANLWAKFKEFELTHPHKNLNIINCENSIGDYLQNCKNCKNVFSGKECEDIANTYLCERARDCLNCVIVGWPGELCYNSISTCVHSFRNLFSSTCWTCSDIYYCESCFDSKNLFGCIGMKNNRNCILNKKYEEKEYKEMLPRIIEHMKKTGEWGKFFPIDLSPFKYEKTIANDYYPIMPR